MIFYSGHPAREGFNEHDACHYNRYKRRGSRQWIVLKNYLLLLSLRSLKLIVLYKARVKLHLHGGHSTVVPKKRGVVLPYHTDTLSARDKAIGGGRLHQNTKLWVHNVENHNWTTPDKNNSDVGSRLKTHSPLPLSRKQTFSLQKCPTAVVYKRQKAVGKGSPVLLPPGCETWTT